MNRRIKTELDDVQPRWKQYPVWTKNRDLRLRAPVFCSGGIGGVRLSDGMSLRDESRPYTVGPSVEARFGDHMAVEFNALYKRLGSAFPTGFLSAGQGTGTTAIISDVPLFEPLHSAASGRVHSWEFPVPGKYYIQDYHLALLPRLLKNQNPNLLVAQFWHIPWPNREVFRAFPWSEELLDGMLGNDLVGFHLQYHCQNFLETLDRDLECKVDQERYEVTRGGKTTSVRSFPVSIDFDAQSSRAASHAVNLDMDRWRRDLGLSGGEVVGIGLDRMDYTKGIPEKLKAVDRFLEQNPAYRGRLVFVQVAVPSRSRIPQYKALAEEVAGLVEEINWRWSTDFWRPITLLLDRFGPVQMAALQRLADFCLLTPLHDGMNLVAKEFVASRFDDDGVLILSNFAGSARELEEALLINPFSLEETTAAILRALETPPDERRKRMQRMRETVAERNVYWWAGRLLRVLAGLEIPSPSERWEAVGK